MFFKRFFCLVFICFFKLISIYGQDEVKSSLTFVIDDTGSMGDDIHQVKLGANAIFDTVMNSNSSQIEDFVLVTFNDPGVNLRTITKQRDVFKSALASINVGGGGDCPELAMSGIELALEKSRPGSYIYVFTDASAKDYKQVDVVKSISQKKQSQVVFVLTGQCGSDSNPDYQAYYQLAAATSGQVFHLNKNEVNKILDYVSETIKSRKAVITTKKFAPGYGNKFNYTVDGKMKDVVISVSGTDPKIDVTGPDSSKPPIEDIVRTPKIAVVKVKDTKPGVHIAEVGSKTDTTAVVTGTTSINFKHGFSVIKPTSIKDTATRPIPDEMPYLSIKLITTGGDVQLKAVQLLDMDETVIMEKPVEMVDEKKKFYVTEPFEPPNTMFKIAIIGIDVETKTPITRIGPTPIEPQKPSLEKKINKAPVVTIDGDPKINAEYDEPLILKCKVSAYPKPSVLWVEKETGTPLSSSVSAVELPYEYMSVLNIEKVNVNATYLCKATNEYGEDTKPIEVETKRKTYFNVVERPRDTTIEYENEGKLVCSIDALPPADIIWYKNGAEITSDDFIEISLDKSILSIKNMQPDIVGNYMCEARNEFDRKIFKVKLSISGVEPPIINKTTTEIHVPRGSDVDIVCRMVQGIPKPRMFWQFKQELSTILKPLEHLGDVLNLKNVDLDKAGVYRCVAHNGIGNRDFHDIDLIVEYPPSIKEDETTIQVNDGEKVTLSCLTDGLPIPSVRWSVNGTEITDRKRYHIYRDFSLSFTATVRDKGNYTCEVTNALGRASRNVEVNTNIPVSIEPPKLSTLKVMVGKHVTLPCRADGYPKPEVKWTFFSTEPHAVPKHSIPSDTSGSKMLPRIQVNQEGYYTCIASNAGGSANITYLVKVFAPPHIENMNPEKRFAAVEGDLVLRIPCKTTGNPKPSITWNKGGFSLALGSKWYTIDEDGTLIVKNVDRAAEGTYICKAENRIGSDSDSYDVIVHPYPKPGYPSSTITLEVGKSSPVSCDLPHTKTDLIRWYKNGRLLTNGELTLIDAKISDSDIYTCRVSTFLGSRSRNVKVVVGFKPKFVSDEETNIDYEEGMPAYLECRAVGEPTPQTTWWHNEKKLNVTDSSYEFEMTASDRGRFFCNVKNEFGSISRRFEIESRECLLNIQTDFNKKQPIMLSPYFQWPSFEVADGHMRIATGENIVLSCPAGFANFKKNAVMALCDRGTNFRIHGHVYKYSDLKCNEELKPVIKNTGHRCLPGNTDTIRIGYEVHRKFLETYEVCLDKDKNMPLYAKYNIHRTLSDTATNITEWFDSDLLPIDFDELYSCKLQINTISSLMAKWFHYDDECCFAKRQLVNPRDMLPGLAQKSTYSYLNVIPHWSTCNVNNWDSVERRVRSLAKTTTYPLRVWTGSSKQLELPSGLSTTNIYISDKDSRQQPVPRYLWKVIQDPVTKSSLAIVQVNIPDLTPLEAPRHVFCRDICGEVEWMRSTSWHDVNKGYTYCCSIKEFQRAFGYDRLFDRGFDKILYDVSVIPEHSLLY